MLKPESMSEPTESADNLYSIAYFEEVAGGDRDFITKMVSLFIELTPGLVADMNKAYEQHDLKEMGRLAHKVKPNIANMGISSLITAIREIEEAGKSGEDSPSLAPMLLEVKNVLEKVVQQLKKEYLFT